MAFACSALIPAWALVTSRLPVTLISKLDSLTARWVKGKAPVGGPGLHFLEGAFLHGALGGHPPSFSFDTNSTHAISPRSAGLRNFTAVGGTDPPGRASLILLRPSQQLRQFGDAAALSVASSFHQISRSASARFAFKINIGHGEVVGVVHDVRRCRDISRRSKGAGKRRAGMFPKIARPTEWTVPAFMKEVKSRAPLFNWPQPAHPKSLFDHLVSACQ
jgi:hypothetical protein